MHLYKRGRIWWLEYIVDGKKHRQSCHTSKRKDAETWLNAIRTAKEMPTFDEAVEVLRMLYRKPREGVIALDAAWDQYEKLAKAVGKLEISEKSQIDRRNVLRNFVDWVKRAAGTIRTVEAVSGAIAAKYAQELAASGRKSKTRQNIIGHLSTIWTMLEKASADIRNPWQNLSPKDTDSERLEAFTPEQEAAVLAAAREVGKDWEPVCVIARHTGLRYGDIATLRWDEVDLERGVIHRKPRKTRSYGIAVTLPLIEPVREAIEGLERTSEYLFPLHASLYGRRGKNVQALLNFREVLDEAGIDGRYTFHSWRHTAATRLAEAGAGIETRQRVLGHRTVENAERYDHAEHLEEVRAAMEAAAGE